MLKKTESEVAFEDACHFFNIKFEPIPRSDNLSPDYKIYLSGNLIVAEVKQFDLNDEERRVLQECRITGPSIYWPAEEHRIRSKIHDANPQLKVLTKGKYPGVLVLFAGSSIGKYEAEEIHAAMYGNESYNYAVPKSATDGTLFFGASLAQNGECKPKRHTTTSAIVIIQPIESERFRMLFYHNTFAKNPVKPDWLRCEGIRHFASKQADEISLPDWASI